MLFSFVIKDCFLLSPSHLNTIIMCPSLVLLQGRENRVLLFLNLKNLIFNQNCHSGLLLVKRNRKLKIRKEKRKVGRHDHCKQEKSVDGVLPRHKLQDRSSENKSLRTSRLKYWKKEKRDSGIIGDSFNDSDFY